MSESILVSGRRLQQCQHKFDRLANCMNKSLVFQYYSNDVRNLDNHNPCLTAMNNIHLILHSLPPIQQTIEHLVEHIQQYQDNQHMCNYQNLDKFQTSSLWNESNETRK